jgi:hypothetical protein
MRGALVACLLASALLSGCTGGDGGNEGPGEGGSGTTGPATSSTTTPAGNGTLAQFGCTIQVGLTGNANLNNGTGGCILTRGLARDGTLQEIDPASGCVGWYDTTPGDASTEGVAAAGSSYPKGTALGVYCDATATPGARSTASVMYGS